MCCVMPPASVDTIWLFLRLSSRVVLPWSTWPMMVTTGGRGTRLDGSAGGLRSEVKGQQNILIDQRSCSDWSIGLNEQQVLKWTTCPRYLLWTSLLGLSLLSLSLAHLNFIPDRVTTSLIHFSSRTESGSRESRSTEVFSRASTTWSETRINVRTKTRER